MQLIHKKIIQVDICETFVINQCFDVDTNGLKINKSTSPLWLVDTNWRAIAECSFVVNSLSEHVVRCDYIYTEPEAEIITKMLVRLFAGYIDPYIYLLAPKQDYVDAKAKGFFIRDSLEDEGFIHATPYSQLMRLANKYYTSVKEPHLLKVDKALIKPEVKWEPAKGGLYPHIYGPLNSDAIVDIEPLSLDSSGQFVF